MSWLESWSRGAEQREAEYSFLRAWELLEQRVLNSESRLDLGLVPVQDQTLRLDGSMRVRARAGLSTQTHLGIYCLGAWLQYPRMSQHIWRIAEEAPAGLGHMNFLRTCRPAMK